jgi:hypothetical protein
VDEPVCELLAVVWVHSMSEHEFDEPTPTLVVEAE